MREAPLTQILGFRLWIPWLCLLWLILGSDPIKVLFAEERPSGRPSGFHETKELSEELAPDFYRLMKQLGSPNYRDRQSAFLKLWKLSDGHRRSDSRRFIEVATQSADLDVAASARWLRVLMDLSTSPVEASRMIEELVLIRSGDTETILRMARNHRWEHLIAMLDTLSTKDRDRLLSESEALAGPRASLLTMAWADHQEHRIPSLVDHLWSNTESIEARYLWKTLGLAEWANRSPVVKLDQRSVVYWEMTLDCINDRVMDASRRARSAGREDLANSVLLANGLWDQSIPAKAAQIPLPHSKITGMAAVEAARMSLLLQWSGHRDLGQKWADSLGPPASKEDDVAGVLLAMCVCDRADEALNIARLRQPDKAYDCFVRQGRIDEAMQCVGIEKLDPEAVQDWANALLEKASNDQQADIELMTRMANVGSLFSRLGLSRLGKIVDNAAIQRASVVHGDHQTGTGPYFSNIADVSRERWTSLFENWTSQHRRTFAVSQFQKLLQEGIDDELRDSILRVLYGNRDETSNFYPLAAPALLWFRRQYDGDWQHAAADVEALFSGREPTLWQDASIRDGLAWLGQSLLGHGTAEPMGDELALPLARLALAQQRADLAKGWLCVDAEPSFQEWLRDVEADPAHGRDESPEASEHSKFSSNRLALLSEIFIHQKQFPQAIVVLEKLSELDPDRIDFALRRSKWLHSVGEIEASKQLRLQALSLPLSTSETRLIVAGLERDELHAEAELLLRHALRSLVNPSLDDLLLSAQLTMLQHARLTSSNSYRALSEREQKQLIKDTIEDDRRQLLSRLAIFPELKVQMQNTLLAVELLHRATVRLAIIENDFEAADRAFRACHAANPDNIETPIELIPDAERTFGTARIEAWIELYSNSLESHLKRWPDDTLVANNLAWLYANVDRRLERALELSRHVAQLLPDDSVYLDTLAEVEFRMGNIDNAISLSSRCRRLAPLEEHHRTQLHRFLSEKSKHKD